VLAAASGVASAQTSSPAPPPGRGPIETREQWLLAQPHLTLPVLTPDPLPAGALRIRVDEDGGNDFGWQPRFPGEASDLSFMVDGEHWTLGAEVSKGLTPSVTLAIRLPLMWRGGGFMDGIIDRWHSLTHLPGGGRGAFPTGAFHVEGEDGGRLAVSWDSKHGTGLGRAEISGRWAFARSADGWRAAVVGRIGLPTGTGPFASGGVDLGGQLLAAHQLGSAFDVYLGAGGTLFGEDVDDGLVYARFRPHGFFVLEWRPGWRWSLLAEVSGAGPLVTNVDAYPDLHAYFKLGSKVDLSRRWRIEGGFVEGIKNLQATTDFGVFLGLSRGF
jgi:hypothetical protein